MRRLDKVVSTTLVMCISMALFATGCQKKEEKTSEKANKENVSTTAEVTTEEPTTAESVTAQPTTVEETTTEAETESVSYNVIEGGYSSNDYDGIKIDDLVNKVKESTEFESLYEYDKFDLMDYYGIDVSICEDYAFYVSEVSPCVDTIAMFQLKSKDNNDVIADALQVYMDSLITSTQDYAPEEFDKVSNAGVKIEGNFVYLIIAKDTEAANKVMEEAFNQDNK